MASYRREFRSDSYNYSSEYELKDGRLVDIALGYVSLYDMQSHQCLQVRNLRYPACTLGEVEPGIVVLWFLLGGTIGVWNIHTGAFTPRFLPLCGVKSAVLSLDMKTVVTSSVESVQFWSLNERTCIGEIKTSVVITIMIFINQNVVVAGTSFQLPTAPLIEIEVPSGLRDGSLEGTSSYRNKFFPFEGIVGKVRVMAALGDGSFLCGSDDSTITRWSSRGDCFQIFPLECMTTIISITVLDEDTFASLHIIENTGVIRRWCLRTGKRLNSFEVSNTRISVHRLILLRKDLTLAGLLRPNRIDVWSVKGEHLESIQEDEESNFYSLCEVNDGRLVTGSQEGQIKVWCRSDGNNKGGGCTQTFGRCVRGVSYATVTQVVEAKKISTTSNGGLVEVTSLLVSCSWEGIVTVWDLEAGVPLVEFEHKKTSSSLAGSLGVPAIMTLLEDRSVICTAKEYLIKTWDLDGRCLSCYSVTDRQQGAFLLAMVETKDGSLIVGYEDGRLDVVRRPFRCCYYDTVVIVVVLFVVGLRRVEMNIVILHSVSSLVERCCKAIGQRIHEVLTSHVADEASAKRELKNVLPEDLYWLCLDHHHQQRYRAAMK